MLNKISLRQKDKLLEYGANVNDDTLVLEALQMFRDIHSPLYKVHDNYAVVRVYISAYFIAEVQLGYIPISGPNEDTVGYKWYSGGEHSWEDSESKALDYLLKIYKIN